MPSRRAPWHSQQAHLKARRSRRRVSSRHLHSLKVPPPVGPHFQARNRARSLADPIFPPGVWSGGVRKGTKLAPEGPPGSAEGGSPSGSPASATENDEQGGATHIPLRPQRGLPSRVRPRSSKACNSRPEVAEYHLSQKRGSYGGQLKGPAGPSPNSASTTERDTAQARSAIIKAPPRRGQRGPQTRQRRS